jgi:hypothetical protein
MATHSATLFWSGLRHPWRGVTRQLSKRTSPTSELCAAVTAAPTHDCQSSERLERIAAYARSGYFHMEYTAGMFVVPLEIPPE